MLTFARSALTGAAATIVDLAVLATLIGAFGVNDRLASIPALLLGGTAQFIGNRHYAFDAASGSIRRQLLPFLLTETIALGANGIVFDLVARQAELTWWGATLVRAAISFVVFVGWSYPLWRRIFQATVAPPEVAA